MNWIEGYDEEGRPVGRLDLPIEYDHALEGWSSLPGADMFANAYNPLTGNLYLVAANVGKGYMGDKFEEIKIIRSVRHFGASLQFMQGYAGPWMLAVDVSSGAEAWRKPGLAAGMLTTAGNLVFYTDETGIFHAANATTGESLYTFNLGKAPRTGPITYMLDGKQYVVQPVGGVPTLGYEECRLDCDSILVAFSR